MKIEPTTDHRPTAPRTGNRPTTDDRRPTTVGSENQEPTTDHRPPAPRIENRPTTDDRRLREPRTSDEIKPACESGLSRQQAACAGSPATCDLQRAQTDLGFKEPANEEQLLHPVSQ